MDPEFVRALAAPVATALLAALGVAIKDWRQRRSTAARLRQTIADATQRLGFLREWMVTQQEVMDPEEGQELKAEVRQTTERIYREVERAERMYRAAEEAHQTKKAVSDGFSLRGVLLLGKVQSSTLGRVAKGLYQFGLALTVVMLVVVATGPPEEGESRAATALYGVLGLILIAVLPLMFLRWLALRSVRAVDRHPPSPPAPVAGPRLEGRHCGLWALPVRQSLYCVSRPVPAA